MFCSAWNKGIPCAAKKSGNLQKISGITLQMSHPCLYANGMNAGGTRPGGCESFFLLRLIDRLYGACIVADQLFDPIGQTATVFFRFYTCQIQQVFAQGNAGLCFAFGSLPLSGGLFHLVRMEDLNYGYEKRMPKLPDASGFFRDCSPLFAIVRHRRALTMRGF